MIGLEIELESCVTDDVERFSTQTFNNYWRTTYDGSLRGGYGVEFVLSKPRSGAGASTALKAFDKLMKDLPNKPTTSQSTSTHVHLDMTNTSLYDVLKFLFLYRIFETALIKSCGSTRVSNLYCMSFQEANKPFMELARVLKDPSNLSQYNMNEHKYGACNLAALTQYGSLEFRSKGGVTTAQEVIDWVNTLTSIKIFADSLESFEDVLSLASREHADIVQTVFGEYADSVAQFFQIEDMWEACMDIQYVINEAWEA